MRRFLLPVVLVSALSAQTLDTVASAYHKTPNPKTRAAVLRFASAHPNDKNGALALLVLGFTEISERQFGDALQHLKAAAPRLPQLADYTGYWSAVAESELREFSAVEAALAPVWQTTPPSPLLARAVELQVNAYLQDGSSKHAIELIQKHVEDLTEPQRELLLARGYETDGNAASSAAHYQRIYVEFPLSKEAAVAEPALSRAAALDPKALLARGLKLEEGGDHTRARKELTALLPRLSGADLDIARVRIGAARYQLRENAPAHEYLSSFESATAETEAERLYYLLECSRRLDRLDQARTILDKLNQSYPKSNWRLQAIVSLAGYYTAHDQPTVAEPLYKTCYESFPATAQAQQCHWKVAWAAYMRDPSPAAMLLEDHLKRYPDSEHASTALYFLGRVGELRSDWGAARSYYDELTLSYPNYYYSMLARDRLREKNVAGATPSAQVVQFLSASQVPKRRRADSFIATTATKQRLDRAHLLTSAGMDDVSEDELRYGAKVDGQPYLMAVELAELANRRDSPDMGIRYIKRYAPGYMSIALDTAPDRFWRLAFPFPYREALEQYCREHSLDPYMVAALIRQESEFNPKAVSRANARGLTQVMPATGRDLSRRLKIRPYSTPMLFQPDTNLQIGTYYLKALFDQLQGKWEAALASYNAGKTHAVAWMASANYREPAEFVESIPFSETRAYVQSVMRNAEVYRRLYGQKSR